MEDMLDTEATFQQYLPMCWSMARRFSRQYQAVPLEDLAEEAISHLGNVVCGGGTWDYDPSRCGTSSRIYQCLYWHLKTVCLKRINSREKRMGDMTTDESSPSEPIPFRRNTSWNERMRWMMCEMSEDAKTVFLTLVEVPSELMEQVTFRAPKRSANAVRRYLLELGWQPERLDAAWNELEECIN